MPGHFVSVLDEMRDEWDRRAHEDARGHSCARPGVSEADFLASGEAMAAYLLGSGHLPAPSGEVEGEEVGKRVAIEIGCGAGRLLAGLSPHFDAVHGVDVSGAMLEAARPVAEQRSNVQLHRGDGMTLRCVRRVKAALVVCHDVMPHLPDAELVGYLMRQAGYRLTRDGRFAIHLPSGHPLLAKMERLAERAALVIAACDERDDAVWSWLRARDAE